MYDLLGVKLKTPIIVGSGPLSYDAEGMKRLSDAGAGAVVTKTIRKERAINPAPHMVRSTNNTLINNEKWTDFDPERWINEELPKLKEMDVVTIASIGHTLEESSELIEPIAEAGADLIELVSYNYLDLVPMVKDAKTRTDLPIIVKLPPMIDNIGDFCKELEDAGADAITACDSVGPAFRIDIETGMPLLGGDGFGWLSGQAIKPITLHKIFEIRQKISLPIIGLGGCTTAADAVEMIMAGANFVGVCTLPILKGPESLGRLYKDFRGHMERLGYDSIDEFTGKVHQYMGDVNERTKFEFSWEEDKCIRCNLCVKVCAYKARTLDETMELDEEECRFCGLCASVCPTDALQVVELTK